MLGAQIVGSPKRAPYATHTIPLMHIAVYGMGATSPVVPSFLNCFIAWSGAKKHACAASGGNTLRKVRAAGDRVEAAAADVARRELLVVALLLIIAAVAVVVVVGRNGRAAKEKAPPAAVNVVGRYEGG